MRMESVSKAILFPVRASGVRARASPIVLPLYIEYYFGWFIDEVLSSVLARYRLFLSFFFPHPNASRATLSITGSVLSSAAHPSPHSLLLLYPPRFCPCVSSVFLSFSQSSLYRHPEWQALVTSSLQFAWLRSVDCAFRRSAGFKKRKKRWTRTGEWERKRAQRDRGNDKFVEAGRDVKPYDR